MPKKKYIGKSRSRQKHKQRSNIAGTLAAVAIGILVYLIYTAIQNRVGEHHTAHSAKYDARALAEVVVPDNVPQQMVEYPGFTVCFNSRMHVPNYVAWELTAAETNGNVKRLNNFFKDNEVDGCPDPSDYKKSGYTRGHMAPAADMKWSEEAMHASHYLTNVCPQLAAMNSGAWATLEDNCRAWARRDSAIIIITGPVLTDRMPLHIGRSHVTVPERFFKVILAPYANPPRGIGFVMPNGRVNGGVQNCAMSIHQVEEITGYDFFSALPDDIENEVERQNSYPRWQTAK
ncbi:MAG: DNA/RNA non-specific endonuclease [Muribaculaceae bacterium]|nr:DNA/RNA non-specific endonuclease [Muribaculaceae bacterium]